MRFFKNRPKSPYIGVLFALLLVYFHFNPEPPISFARDPNKEKCLPDLHLALLIHHAPKEISRGDLVFWKPAGAVSYVKQEYVLKMVGGIPGDRLTIKDGNIYINGAMVGTGLSLSPIYHTTPKQLERDEIIPAGSYFVMGTNPLSDDSRYWGYLPGKAIQGKGYKIY